MSSSPCSNPRLVVLVMILIGHHGQQVANGQEQQPAGAVLDDPCMVVRCTSGTRCMSIEGCAYCCPSACTKIYAPVCGSDGQTYNNECLLRRAACERQQQIVQVSEGQCGGAEGTDDADEIQQPSGRDCDLMCTADYRPVCGTDGKTYSNSCQLRVAACLTGNNQLVQAHEGECKSGCDDE